MDHPAGVLPPRFRRLIPDLAAVVSVFTLFYCLIVYRAPRNFFRDTSTGLHIVTGEKIAAAKDLPRNDPYSFSQAGQPWIDWEWGADWIMGRCYRLDGLRGVAWIFALAIALVAWLWVRLHWACGGNLFLAILLLPAMLAASSPAWLALPHVFAWILALGLLWYIEGRESDFRFQPLDGTVFGLGGALWANLHPTFLLAPLITLTYAAAHALRPRSGTWTGGRNGARRAGICSRR